MLDLNHQVRISDNVIPLPTIMEWDDAKLCENVTVDEATRYIAIMDERDRLESRWFKNRKAIALANRLLLECRRRLAEGIYLSMAMRETAHLWNEMVMSSRERQTDLENRLSGAKNE